MEHAEVEHEMPRSLSTISVLNIKTPLRRVLKTFTARIPLSILSHLQMAGSGERTINIATPEIQGSTVQSPA